LGLEEQGGDGKQRIERKCLIDHIPTIYVLFRDIGSYFLEYFLFENIY
jgi:hypothetical protein